MHIYRERISFLRTSQNTNDAESQSNRITDTNKTEICRSKRESAHELEKTREKTTEKRKVEGRKK